MKWRAVKGMLFSLVFPQYPNTIPQIKFLHSRGLSDAHLREYVHTHTHKHTHARTHARTHTRTHARIHAHARTHTHVYIHSHNENTSSSSIAEGLRHKSVEYLGSPMVYELVEVSGKLCVCTCACVCVCVRDTTGLVHTHY